MKINEKAKNFAAKVGLIYFFITLIVIVCVIQIDSALVPGNFFTGLFTPGALILILLYMASFVVIPVNLCIYCALATSNDNNKTKNHPKGRLESALNSIFSFYFHLINIALIVIFINAQFGLRLF